MLVFYQLSLCKQLIKWAIFICKQILDIEIYTFILHLFNSP